jgi:hypothetical protein
MNSTRRDIVLVFLFFILTWVGFLVVIFSVSKVVTFPPVDMGRGNFDVYNNGTIKEGQL